MHGECRRPRACRPDHLARSIPGPGPFDAYHFTGRLWTYPELAVVLADVSGRPVSYREVDEDEGAIGMMGIAPFVQSGAFELQTADLEAVLGHPAASLHEAVAAALS